MNFLPVFLNLKENPCLVVGGGDVAARKVSALLKAHARVTVVAPELCDRLQAELESGNISWYQRAFEASDLDDCVLVYAATNDEQVNIEVSQLARERHLPVNVADNPPLCSFIMPSIIDRSPVQIAISTGGASPVLARLLRTRLETLIPGAYGRMAEIMAGYRQRVQEKFDHINQRRRFWEDVLQGPVAEMLMAGQEKAALETLEKILDESQASHAGEVYLVGAGPGDPDLLTFRALRLMQQAEVVLYDRLVSPAILDLVRRDADLIYVGKQKSNHAVPQDEINALLVKLAREGKRVLRLKGGDPFIFGRGGEEIDSLSAEGVPFQIVPGITAAAGCASYAGIPLTHRDHAQSCVFITGHLKDGSMDLNWETLIQPHQTVVVYMGLTGIEALSAGLIEHGLPADKPAALISKGTTREQVVYVSTIGELPQVASQYEIHAPTLIIIGEVVTLQGKLSWFEPEASPPEQ